MTPAAGSRNQHWKLKVPAEVMPARGKSSARRRSCAHACSLGLEGPDDASLPSEAHGTAEEIRFAAVARNQLMDPHPRRRVVDVGGSGGVAEIIIQPGPDQRGRAAVRDGEAELAKFAEAEFMCSLRSGTNPSPRATQRTRASIRRERWPRPYWFGIQPNPRELTDEDRQQAVG